MLNINSIKYGNNLRIYGKSISMQKTILYGFKNIFGLGYSTLNKLLRFTKIKPTKKLNELSNFELNLLLKTINKFKILLDVKLRRTLRINIIDKIALHNYQGIRHQLKLPVRGQRTRSNAKTQRKF